MRKFRLYAFSDGYKTIITRGENQEQAMSYACRTNDAFKKGVTVFPLDYLPINSKELYNTNHNEGWLYRSPIWLQKAEQKQAIELGFAKILDSIKKGSKLQTLMYKDI